MSARVRLSCALVLVVLVGLGGCARQVVTVYASEIGRMSPELRRRGRADIWIPGSRYRLAMEDEVEVELADRAADPSDRARPRRAARLSVSQLLADCPTTAFSNEASVRQRYPRCLLLAGSQEVVVDRRLTAVPGAVGAGAVNLLVVGGLVYCTVACDSPWNYVTGGTLAAVAVATTAIAIYVWRRGERSR